jgi:porin
MLGFLTETQHRFTEIPPDDLGQRLGSLWPTSESFGEQQYALVELWWEQHIFRDGLTMRVGKIEPKDFFDVFRYESFTQDFLNFAFTENPAIAFPDEGLGCAVGLKPWKWIYLNVGLSDANSKNTTSGFSTFFSRGEFFYGVELGVTPRWRRLGKGAYKITFWQVDATSKADEPSGRGLSLTLEQEIGHGLVPFCRYSYADGEATDLRQLVFWGLGLEKPFQRRDDLAALGLAWGQPQDQSLPDQIILKLFTASRFFRTFRWPRTCNSSLTLLKTPIKAPSWFWG